MTRNRKLTATVAELAAPRTGVQAVRIKPPNMQYAVMRISNEEEGAPYVQNKFAARVLEAIAEKQAGIKPGKLPPKDFEAAWREATHVSDEGWYGIPATSFRNAMISACRLVDVKMTLAKLCLFIKADGYETDRFGKTPLVRIYGEPKRTDFAVRNADGGADIRPRPMWDSWWAEPTIKYDGDQFSLSDVVNLMARVGIQVAIGAGRHDSKMSAGMGWGTFTLTGPAKPTTPEKKADFHTPKRNVAMATVVSATPA